MPVSTNDLWASANLIRAAAQNEADFRAGISRAYYSSYHTALNFHSGLSSPGASKPNCGEHENLVNKLLFPTTKVNDEPAKSKVIGYLLKGLLYSRRQADYKLNDFVTNKSLEIVFENSERLLEEL